MIPAASCRSPKLFISPAFFRLALLGAVGVYLALAMYRLGAYSLWLDEIMAVNFTEGSPRDVIQAVGDDVHGPVYYLILWAFLQLGSFTEFLARLPGVLAGALTLVAVYALARQLHAPWCGLWACVLLAVSPFFLQYSRETHPYSLSALFVALSWLAFASVLRRGRWRTAAVYGATCALAFLTFYLSAFALLPQLLLGFHPRLAKRKRVRLLLGWAIAALLIAPWLPTFMAQLKRDNVGTLASFPEGVELVHIMQSVREPVFGSESPLSRAANSQAQTAGNILALGLFSVAAIALLRRRRQLRDHQRAAGRLAAFGLAAAYFVFLLVCLKQPLLVPRYLTMLAPLLALFFGAGLALLRPAGAAALLALYLALALPAYGNYQQAMPYVGEDWRGAVRVLEQQAEPYDLLLASNTNTVSCLVFYLRKVDRQSWEERVANWEQFQNATGGRYIFPERTLWFFMRDNATENAMLQELKEKNRYGGAIQLQGVFSLHRFHGRSDRPTTASHRP